MNAVKRCLTVLAVALVAGACGGDPTADEAGTNLTIRATPSALWVRDNATGSLTLEAVDKLGGAVSGSWTIGTIVGPFQVVLDSAYQNTSTGGIGIKSQYQVIPTAEGEGSVVFSGTGGSITIPVRIAPDTGAFHVVMSDTTPALFQALTLTAPAGIAFTGGTTVRFFNGPQSRDTSNGGLSFPQVLSRSADSSQITFMPGPSANGTMRISGLVSRSTPSLATTARADFAMAAVPPVDTNAFSVTPAFRSTGNRTTATVFDTLVLTAPANYRFLSSTTIEFFRLGVSPTTANPTGYAVSNGTSNPVSLGLNADSSQLRFLVAPGARGRLKVNPIAFQAANGIRFMVRGPAAETFDLRSGASGPDTTNFVFAFNKTSPVAEGDTVLVTAPAGMVFLPGTAMINATSAGTPSGGDSARIVTKSADSTQIGIVLPPGASGKFRYSNIARRDVPAIVWQGRSSLTISAAAAPAVVASLTPGTANMNDTVTVALDPTGPYRFRPTSTAEFGGFTAAWAGVSTDSLTLKVLPTPNTAAGPLTLTNIRYGALPAFQVKANTASNLTTNAAFDLGADNATADDTDPVYARIVTLANGGTIGFWDSTTFESPDWWGFGTLGGRGEQDYKLTFTNAGTYVVTVDWMGTNDTDIDIAMINGALDHDEAGSLTGSKPESFTVVIPAGAVRYLLIGFWDGPNPGAIKVTIRRSA